MTGSEVVTQITLPEIVRIVRAEVLKVWQKDSCIASTRVGQRVLSALGIATRPVVVETLIFNQAFVERAIRDGVIPQSADDIKRWSMESCAYSIGIGIPPSRALETAVRTSASRKPWYGHLVSVTREFLLIDWSIDQASRPIYGIQLQPWVKTVAPAFLTGEPERFEHQGGIVSYQARVGDTSYRRASDWGGRDSQVDRVVKRALAAVYDSGRVSGFVPR